MRSFRHTVHRWVAAAGIGAVALSGLVAHATPAAAADGHLGDVTGFSRSGDTYTFSSGAAKVRVDAFGFTTTDYEQLKSTAITLVPRTS